MNEGDAFADWPAGMRLRSGKCAFAAGCISWRVALPTHGAQIARMAREEPVVAVEIEGSILELAEDGLVEVFDDGGSGGVCVLEAGVL